MPLGALGAIGGAVGGASKGFAPALRDVMGRQQEEEQFETQQANTQSYRDEQLGIQQQRVDQAAEQGEFDRAMTRRRDLHERNYQDQMAEISAMRERRLTEGGTPGNEKTERALNAAEAVAAHQARRPVFDPARFRNYAEYRKALDEHIANEKDIWRTFGLEGPDQAAKFMPGGEFAKPSNHNENRPSPLSQYRDMQEESGLSIPQLGTQYGELLGPGGG